MVLTVCLEGLKCGLGRSYPTLKDFEMPEIPWLKAEGGIKRFKGIGALEWVYHF